jgi:hypothetical protein
VLDNEGKVVGLVESGVPGAGLNFATPVAKLKKMLDGPLVIIDPVTVDYSQRTKRRNFSIQINSISHSAIDYDVDFKLTDPKGAVQTVSGKSSAGKCDLLIAPTTDKSTIKWDPFVDPPPGFKFVLTLKQSGKVFGTETGTLYITNVPMPGGIARGNPPRKGAARPPRNPHPTAAAGQKTPPWILSPMMLWIPRCWDRKKETSFASWAIRGS